MDISGWPSAYSTWSPPPACWPPLPLLRYISEDTDANVVLQKGRPRHKKKNKNSLLHPRLRVSLVRPMAGRVLANASACLFLFFLFIELHEKTIVFSTSSPTSCPMVYKSCQWCKISFSLNTSTSTTFQLLIQSFSTSSD